jgi:lipopolysaccharide/colanic/teichoic acid biosynthesis glycosyltransferase
MSETVEVGGWGEAEIPIYPEGERRGVMAPILSGPTSLEQGSERNKMWPEGFIEEGTRGADLRHLAGPTKPTRVLKRVMDLTLVFIFLPVWGLVMMLLGLVVKLSDSGPIFFRRRVMGPKGSFHALKLRTMRVDADPWLEQHPELMEEFRKNFKLKEDPRVTKVGKFLRKYSLDELPQFLNVVKGQMSLVGPRMVSLPELEKYGPYQALLLTVKPGMTGYWQVSGRQEVSYEERVKMDMFYIQNWSLWFDCKILCLTVWKALKREGAY